MDRFPRLIPRPSPSNNNTTRSTDDPLMTTPVPVLPTANDGLTNARPAWWPLKLNIGKRQHAIPPAIELGTLGASARSVVPPNDSSAAENEPLPTPPVFVKPWHLDFKKWMDDQLEYWASAGIPTTTLLANELGAEAGGPLIRAEQQEDGADERVERGQRVVSRANGLSGESTSDGGHGEGSGHSRELEEGLQDPAEEAPSDRYYDQTRSQREAMLAAERRAGGDAGIWFVQSGFALFGAISASGWDMFAKLRLRSARITPCLYQSAVEPSRHSLRASDVGWGILGFILFLFEAPFVVVWCILCFIFKWVGKHFRFCAICAITYFVLLFGFGVDPVKLAIGVLKAAPGFFKA